MTVYEGAWKYGGGNGMQVVMEVTWSGVNSSSSSVTATVKFYTDNQYAYDDNQTLDISSNLGSNYSYNNTQGTAQVLRVTRTYTYNYSTWGSSPGNVTFGATVTGTYNGISPTVSATIAIPARPGGPPTVSSATATASINQITVSWAASGDPGITSYNVYRNNDAGQLVYSGGANAFIDYVGPGVTAYYIVYAYNAAGNGYKLTSSVTTPTYPGPPEDLEADASTFGQITLTWSPPVSNGGTAIGEYEVRRNGVVKFAGPYFSWTDFTVAPSTTYYYSIRSRNAVGYSSYNEISVTSLGGIARIYNGTTNVTALPKIYDGTDWVDGQARAWDGTEWKYGS